MNLKRNQLGVLYIALCTLNFVFALGSGVRFLPFGLPFPALMRCCLRSASSTLLFSPSSRYLQRYVPTFSDNADFLDLNGEQHFILPEIVDFFEQTISIQ